MAKMIVTGAAGFIGSHLIESLLNQGHEVVAIDNLATGFRENIEAFLENMGFQFFNSDIETDDINDLCLNADTIFHLAARISVPESMEQPFEYFNTNSLGTLKLLEICRRHGIKNFVLSSSAAVYGDNPALPKIETMTPDPKSPYAISKLDGEYLCAMFRQNYAINAVALRYFNVFGPRQALDSAYAAAIPIFINKAISNEDIVIYGDGLQTRDFVFVKTVVAANLAAAKLGGDVVNVAGGKSMTILELAKTIIELTQSESRIIFEAPRAGDIKHSYADITRLTEVLHVTSDIDFMTALKLTIDAYCLRLK